MKWNSSLVKLDEIKGCLKCRISPQDRTIQGEDSAIHENNGHEFWRTRLAPKTLQSALTPDHNIRLQFLHVISHSVRRTRKPDDDTNSDSDAQQRVASAASSSFIGRLTRMMLTAVGYRVASKPHFSDLRLCHVVMQVFVQLRYGAGCLSVAQILIAYSSQHHSFLYVCLACVCIFIFIFIFLSVPCVRLYMYNNNMVICVFADFRNRFSLTFSLLKSAIFGSEFSC